MYRQKYVLPTLLSIKQHCKTPVRSGNSNFFLKKCDTTNMIKKTENWGGLEEEIPFGKPSFSGSSRLLGVRFW